MNRKSFLAYFGFLVSGFLALFSKCSNQEEVLEIEQEDVSTPSEDEINYLEVLKKIGAKGFLKEDQILYIHLEHQDFSSLKTEGNFVNFYELGLLILRIDKEEIGTYDHCCPHRGTIGSWTYANGKFRCGAHGNYFSIEGDPIVFCNSNARNGSLKSFKTILFQDLITVQF